jgi:hypothetical protein
VDVSCSVNGFSTASTVFTVCVWFSATIWIEKAKKSASKSSKTQKTAFCCGVFFCMVIDRSLFFTSQKKNQKPQRIGESRKQEIVKLIKFINNIYPFFVFSRHGSSIANFVGILTEGLRIAPPEARATGAAFGRGSMFSSSASVERDRLTIALLLLQLVHGPVSQNLKIILRARICFSVVPFCHFLV